MKITTTSQIKTGYTTIKCNEHPEYGMATVVRDNGEWFEIRLRAGVTTLSYNEAERFWSVCDRNGVAIFYGADIPSQDEFETACDEYGSEYVHGLQDDQLSKILNTTKA